MTNARFCLGDPAVLEILSEKSCRVVACTHIVVGKDVPNIVNLLTRILNARGRVTEMLLSSLQYD